MSRIENGIMNLKKDLDDIRDGTMTMAPLTSELFRADASFHRW